MSQKDTMAVLPINNIHINKMQGGVQIYIIYIDMQKVSEGLIVVAIFRVVLISLRGRALYRDIGN